MGALLNILQSEADGEDTGITIDHIYYDFASLDWYKTHELGDLGTADAILTALAGLPKDEACPVKKGDEILVDDVCITVLNDRYEPDDNHVGERDGNDASMVYRMLVNGVTILFTGDLQVDGGNHVLETVAKEDLKADIVQMAHHGQHAVTKEFYEAVSPKICLWPTPQWLWDNEDGKYTTPETKAWMKELGVEKALLHERWRPGDPIRIAGLHLLLYSFEQLQKLNTVFDAQLLVNVMDMFSQRGIADVKLLTDIRSVFSIVHQLKNL